LNETHFGENDFTDFALFMVAYVVGFLCWPEVTHNLTKVFKKLFFACPKLKFQNMYF